MSTHEDRKPPAAPDMGQIQAMMAAAVGEVARQRDQAQGRCVELATALVVMQARVAEFEAAAKATPAAS